MSKNIDQVFIANPITSNAGTDLMYFGQSPYGAGNDAAMLYSNFKAQFTLNVLTTKGDILAYDTAPDRLAVGTTNGQVLQVNSGAAIGLSWSTATYPTTTTINQILFSSAANTVSGITTANSGTLITSAGGVPSISSTLPTAVQSNITQLGAQSQALNMNSNLINNVSSPVSATDAANKQYADNIGGGLNPIEGVAAATTANLNATYSNGVAGVGATLTNAGAQAAFAVDGYSASANDRILVKNQTSTFQNGIYTVTTVGNGSTNWVLTRATDYNTPTEIQKGDLTVVQNGTVNTGSSWLQTSSVTTIGTDAITFSAFFTPATYLQVANNLSDVNNANTSFNNISPLTTKGDLLGFSTVNARLAVGSTNGQILQVNSAGTVGFSWSTPTYPSASGSTGTILRSNGTNNVYSTATFADTYSASNILYSNGANTVTGLATANGGVLVTSNTGVPSILAGSGTTGTILQATASGTPAWSTATYPATTTINQILFSSAANVVGGITTANSSILQTNGSGVPSFSTSLPSGIAYISTVDQTSASVTLAVNTQYVTDNGASLVTYTLPTTCAIGSIFKILGFSSGGWKVAQSSGQQIHVGSTASTLGATGSIASSNQYDCVYLTCVAANNTFVANAVQGNLTIV